MTIPVCDRIENSDRTGTGPDWDHFDRNRTGTGPDFKPKKVNRNRLDWPDFYRIFKTLTFNLKITNINIAASIFRYELKGKARTRPDNIRFVSGPCAQCSPFEASEQTWGQKPKSAPKEIKL